MLIRCKLIGGTADDDPFRVDLPTYQMVQVDYLGGTALVSVPDDVFPEGLKAVALPDVTDRINAVKRKGDQPKWLAEWHTHLDTVYKDAKRKFRPEIV